MKISAREMSLFSTIFFFGLLFVLPKEFIPQEIGSTVLTVVGFLFGIMAGFYIVVTSTDYNAMKNLIAQETGFWIILYKNVRLYDAKTARKLSVELDAYVRRNFDAELIDYSRVTQDEFAKIEKTLDSLPQDPSRSSDYQTIRQAFGSIVIARQQLTVLGAKSLSAFEWAVLFILSLIFVLTLYGLRSGNLFFDFTVVAISVCVWLVLRLIRDLDAYVWNESGFSFDVFQNVCVAVGELPYYPYEVVLEGRVVPREGQYRIGVLKENSTEREIRVEGSM